MRTHSVALGKILLTISNVWSVELFFIFGCLFRPWNISFRGIHKLKMYPRSALPVIWIQEHTRALLFIKVELPTKNPTWRHCITFKLMKNEGSKHICHQSKQPDIAKECHQRQNWPTGCWAVASIFESIIFWLMRLYSVDMSWQRISI